MRGIKNKNEGAWKKWVIFFLLLVILAVLLNSVRKVYEKKREAQKALVHMQEQLEELAQREQFLKRSIDRMATKEGLSLEIRKKLNVAEAGESVAIIVDEEGASSTPAQKLSSWQQFKSFWIELFD